MRAHEFEIGRTDLLCGPSLSTRGTCAVVSGAAKREQQNADRVPPFREPKSKAKTPREGTSRSGKGCPSGMNALLGSGQAPWHSIHVTQPEMPVCEPRRFEAFMAAQGLEHRKPPKTRKEMLSREDAEIFLKAEQRELEVLKDAGCFGDPILTSQLPLGVRPMAVKTLYKYMDQDGEDVEGAKVQLVALGNRSVHCNQRAGADWCTCSAEITLRRLLGITVNRGRVYYAATDVKGALRCVLTTAATKLRRPIEKAMSIEPPFDLPKRDEEGRRLCIPLCKTLFESVAGYSRFASHLRDLLIEMGFKAFPIDPCLLRMKRGQHSIFCGFYFDDGIFATTSVELLEQIFRKISAKLGEGTLESFSDILGMQLERDKERRWPRASERKYIRTVTEQILRGPEAARGGAARLTNSLKSHIRRKGNYMRMSEFINVVRERQKIRGVNGKRVFKRRNAVSQVG